MGMLFAYFVTGQILAGTSLAQEGLGSLDDYIDIYLHGLLRYD